jgi:hypothetical protein
MVLSNGQYHIHILTYPPPTGHESRLGMPRPFLWFILYSPFAFVKLAFPIFLIGDLHDVEFLQIVIVLYYADTTDALGVVP